LHLKSSFSHFITERSRARELYIINSSLAIVTSQNDRNV